MAGLSRGLGRAAKVAALGASAAISITACGGAQNGSPEASSSAAAVASEAAEPSPAGEPINIGALYPLTGGGSTFGPGMATVAELTIEEINQDGGVLGRQLNLIIEDDQTQPNAGVTAAQKLINVNGVVAISGPWASSVSLAVAPIAIESGVVLICTSNSDEITVLEDDDFVWRTNPASRMYGRSLAEIAEREGWESVVVLVQNSPGLINQVATFETYYAGDVLAVVTYAPELSDYTTEVREAVGYEPDGYILAAFTPDAALVFQAAYSLGETRGNWAGNAVGINPGTVEAAGPEVAAGAMVGAIATDGYPAVEGQAYQDFNARFEEETGTELASNFYAAQVRDQLISMALAMESAGTVEGEVWKDHLRQIHSPDGTAVYSFAEGKAALEAGETINYEGASGSVDWDDQGDVVTDYVMLQYDGEAFEIAGTIEASLLVD